MIDFELISKLVLAHRDEEVRSVPQLRRKLERWWSLKYSRPFKDPVLQTYTLEELCYEYLFYHYLENQPEEAKKKSEQEDVEWARQMFQKQQELKQAKSKEETASPTVPVTDPVTVPVIPDLPEISTTFSPTE